MSVTICTGWTGRGYDALGAQFCDTFFRYWSKSVRLFVYTDYGNTILPGDRNGMAARLSECEGLAEFLARHKDNPAANGRVPGKTWREKERQEGYSFRTDAVRFVTQLFIPEAAAKYLPDNEVLGWFDADVLTHKDVPDGFVESLMGGADCIYLGREHTHSEIGFWAVRLTSNTRLFLTELAEIYRSDGVFKLAETHSAFVWDEVRSSLGPLVRAKSLTPRGKGHVFPTSPLGPAGIEHLKGERKRALLKRAA